MPPSILVPVRFGLNFYVFYIPFITLITIIPVNINIIIDNITISVNVITRKESNIIRAMLLQPHGAKLVSVGVQGGVINTNFKVTDYVMSQLKYQQLQYSRAHRQMKYKGKHENIIGMSRFVHVLTKHFAEQEPWIFKEHSEFDPHKYQVDLLYSIKCLKQIFNENIPDVKIRTQSDTLICLLGWNLARGRENSDGESVKGFIDYYDDYNGATEPLDGVSDYSKLTKVKAKEILQLSTPPKPLPVYSPTLEELFEEN
jgi:hypothetical protein